jgi:hypothetical protein
LTSALLNSTNTKIYIKGHKTNINNVYGIRPVSRFVTVDIGFKGEMSIGNDMKI